MHTKTDMRSERDNVSPLERLPVLKLTLRRETEKETRLVATDATDALIAVPRKLKLLLSSSASHPPATTSASLTSHGTFLYRPFRLFPLIESMGSRYRVFIPRHWTNIERNRAVALNYLWGGAGVYTDDSDLFCVLLCEGCPYETVCNRDISIQVEVCAQTDHSKTVHPLPVCPLPVQPRSWTSKHDGAYIRIVGWTVVGRDAVHLRRWRKRSVARRVSRERIEPHGCTPVLRPRIKKAME